MALALTDYAGLVATVSAYVGGSSDSNFADAVAIAVQLAEEDIGKLLRTPENTARATLTVDEEWEALPPRCMKLRKVWLGDTTPEREIPDLTYSRTAYNTGIVKGYKLHGLQIGLVPWTAGGSIGIHLAYYERPEPLADADACTAVLGAYPKVYLYGALANLEGFLVNDQRIATWSTLFAQAVQAANAIVVERGSVMGG
jgi:hypothetical protein